MARRTRASVLALILRKEKLEQISTQMSFTSQTSYRSADRQTLTSIS